jgi:hypothetical protein
MVVLHMSDNAHNHLGREPAQRHERIVAPERMESGTGPEMQGNASKLFGFVRKALYEECIHRARRDPVEWMVGEDKAGPAHVPAGSPHKHCIFGAHATL